MSAAHDPVHEEIGEGDNPLAGSLAGVRVIDFSQIAAGPLCTMLLADMGADVIKVEPPTGDVGRTLGPPFVGGESTLFMSLNRNKRGVVLVLKTAEGREQAHTLIAEADVVVESFRPGVADRLGIGAAELTALHPTLVYCSISAFGQSGPWSGRPGVDGVLQAISGMMSITGNRDEPPSKVQAPLVDMLTGFQATIAVLAALQRRTAGMPLRPLDVNLYACAMLMQQIPLSGFLATGELPVRSGSGAPYATPNEAYRTADGHIMIAAYQQRRWKDLCRALRREELADDPLFDTLEHRMSNRDALALALEEQLARRTTSEWVDLLQRSDIICAPVADYHDVVGSPQLVHQGILIDVDHPRAGRVSMPGFAIGGRAIPRSRPSPMLGEHDRLLLPASRMPSA